MQLVFAIGWVFWAPLLLLYNGSSDLQSLLASPVVIVLQTLGAGRAGDLGDCGHRSHSRQAWCRSAAGWPEALRMGVVCCDFGVLPRQRLTAASELVITPHPAASERLTRFMGERAYTQFEMFVYVDVDSAIADLDGISTVLREPADMPWDERVAYVTDPDDNPGALATTTSTSGS